jgi:hypothetical protein
MIENKMKGASNPRKRLPFSDLIENAPVSDRLRQQSSCDIIKSNMSNHAVMTRSVSIGESALQRGC